MDVFLQMLSEYKDKVFPIILGDKSSETPSILRLAINLLVMMALLLTVLIENA